jgi:hypothetical protein
MKTTIHRNIRKAIVHIASILCLLVLVSGETFGQIVVATSDASPCDGDGSATLVSILGGPVYVVGPYARYSVKWSNGQVDVLTATKLRAGGGSVEVTDNLTKCKGSKSFEIKKRKGKVNVGVSGNGIGIHFCTWMGPPKITLQAGAWGGCPFRGPRYNYSWPDGKLEVSSSGTYTCTATDSVGNQGQGSATVIVIPIFCSRDPNEMVGPTGYGKTKFVAKDATLEYTIRYENDPAFATAAASRVTISLPIMPYINMTSFRLKSFGFGEFVFQVPANTANYSQRLDLRDSLGIYLDVVAGVDLYKKQAFWKFQSIDPATGLPPTDPNKGYLPINDKAKHNGEGFATFTWKPDNKAVTGDSILAQSEIVFDINEAIKTNRVFNVVDAVAPKSKIATAPFQSDSTSVKVSLGGSDDAGGSGIKKYMLYVSENDGPFAKYGEFENVSEADFVGISGKYYSFFSRAVDNTGNTEPLKKKGEAYIVIGKRLTPKVTLTDSVICSGDSVLIKATPNQEWTYQWFKNGALVKGATDSMMYAKENGRYYVIISDGLNNYGLSNDVGVTVHTLPEVEISTENGASLCEGGNVTLTTNKSFSTYLWSNGTTTKSNIVDSEGGYYVVVTDSIGCKNKSNTMVLVAKPLPVVTISALGEINFCKGGTVTLKTDKEYSSYKWNSNAVTSSITVDTSGLFSVKITDSNGCLGTSNAIPVVVNPLPDVTITASGSTTLCTGSSVELTTNNDFASYRWNNGLATKTIVADTTGVYWVEITDKNGCKNTSNVATITVNPLPEVIISASGATTFCKGGSVTLNTSKIFNNYAWNNGTSASGVIVDTSGSYWVKVTDVNGCKNTSNTISVTVNPLPEVIISSSGSTIFCKGDSVTLTTNKVFSSYLWNNGASTSSIVAKNNGNYWVEVSDFIGCRNTSNKISVTANPIPVPDFTYVTNNLNVVFTNNSLLATSYQWKFGDNTFEDKVVSPIHQYATSGSYNVVLIAINNNCVDSLTKKINLIGTNVPVSKGQLQIMIYPNPSNGLFKIESDKFLDEELIVTIKDIFGRIVYYRKFIDSIKVEIDLRDRNSQVYFVTIEKGKEAQVKKIIINSDKL